MGPLLRDACVICTNSDFEPSPNEIIVQTLGVLTDEQSLWIEEHIAVLVKGFAKYVCNKRNLKVRNELQDEHGQLLKRYDEFYKSTSHRFRHHFEIAGYKKFKRRWPLERIVSLKHLQKFHKELQLCYTKKLKTDDKETPIEHAQKIAALKSYIEFASEQRAKIMKGWSMLQSDQVPIESARKDLNDFLGFRVDSKHLLLYTPMLMFFDYLASIGVEKEAIKEFKNRTLQAFRKLCCSQLAGNELRDYFANYISDLLVDGKIICIRTARNDDTIGWYDGKKNTVFLPYESFANDFIVFCEKRHGVCTLTRKSLLSELISLGIVCAKTNGSGSAYQRPDIKVVVDPATGEKLEPETVIRLNVESLNLSAEATEILSGLAKVNVRRR